MEKIGLYGGTFAPPHLGHVHAVHAFLQHIPVDELLVMPTFVPPHKVQATGDTPALRLEMCHAAFDGIEKVTVSSYEIDRGDVSYTVQTLRYLAKPEREIYLLCGTDMFLTLENWYQADEIFRLAKIFCVSRTDEKANEITETAERYKRDFDATCVLLPDAPLEVSSTQIREAIRTGEALTPYVPTAVEKILLRENLYKGNES